MAIRAWSRLSFLSLGLAAALAGCGDDGGPAIDASPPEGGEVELGTGSTSFEVLSPESDLCLIAGPQGGHHFLAHARIRDLLPGDPTMPGLVENPSTRFSVTSESGERLEIDMAPYRLGYEADGDRAVLTSGRIVQVEESMVPSIMGARVQLAVEVTDSAGASARDERWIHAIAAIPADAGPGGADPDAAPPL